MKPFQVLYEDNYLKIINKPSNLICEPENFPGLFLCHRLDKDTTGVLVLAKSEEIKSKIQEQFKSRKVQKVYKAVVHGWLHPEKGKVTANIARMPGSGKFGIAKSEGRSAQTAYQVLKQGEQDGNQYSLVELRPTTGRTHQIRVHLKSLGYPIVGDNLYASRGQQEQAKKICTHQLLHAQEITFRHPTTGAILRIAAGVSEEFNPKF